VTAGSTPLDGGRPDGRGEDDRHRSRAGTRARALAALEAELARVDLICRLALLDWRTGRGQPDEFGGFYVSDAEVDRLLRSRERAERGRPDGDDAGVRRESPDGTSGDQPAGTPVEAPAERRPAGSGSTGPSASERPRPSSDRTALVARLAAATRDRRRQVERDRTDGDGQRSRVVSLADRFGLDRRQLDALLVAVAPALDGRYRRVYGYLQDDVSRTRPSVGLVSQLLFGDGDTGGIDAAVRSLVGPAAPLVRHGLVRVQGDGPFTARTVTVDDRIAGYLLGEDALPAALTPFTSVTDPAELPGSGPRSEGPERGREAPAAAPLSPAVRSRLSAAVERHVGRASDVTADDVDWTEGEERTSRPPFVHLYGPYGAGTAAAAATVCVGTGARLLVADLATARPAVATDLDGVVALLAREARLRDAVVCVRIGAAPTGPAGDVDPTGEGAGPGAGVGDPAGTGGARVRLATLVAALDAVDGPVLLTGRDPLPTGLQVRLERHALTSVAVPRPDYGERLARWRAVEGLPAEVDAAELASTFRFTPGQIDDAVRTAAANARADGRAAPTGADVYAGCRAQTGERLATLARKVEPTYGWDDIVLPPDTMAHLREVAAHVRHRGRVYAEWGFADRFALGRGIVALFAGPSGTGKTMAAEIVAGAAGLELFKIDLSRVVSKYIGETEKNLGAVFDAAEDSNAVLLFDEADALFGKRSQVSDAHDRYANVEVNYLLQRVEAFDGVVILTTNFEANIDAAFQRRINHSVDFPLPDEAARRAIWERIFPAETPVDGLDYGFLSSFELTGGAIKNVAVTAALLAADDDGHAGRASDDGRAVSSTAVATSRSDPSRSQHAGQGPEAGGRPETGPGTGTGPGTERDTRASVGRPADGEVDTVTEREGEVDTVTEREGEGDSVGVGVGGPVAMSHLVRALRREFQKTGTLVDPDEFGTYYELAQPERYR
jgi:hypothetical protein